MRSIVADDPEQLSLAHREFSHRVANDLSAVAGLLTKRHATVMDERSKTALGDAICAIGAIGSLYSELDRLGPLIPEIDLAAYLPKLTSQLGAVHANAHCIALHLNGRPPAVSAAIARTLALIVCELVCNAVKHAFPDGRSGAIIVCLDSERPYWRLSVADDGVELIDNITRAKAEGTGLRLVRAMARQLGGEFRQVSAHPGVLNEVIFPAPRLSESSGRAF